MISKEYTNIGSKSSAIREMFDLALERSKVVGEENVYNFCIGNPNVPTPECVKEELMHLLETENPFHLHGYTTSAGDEEARDAIAEGLNDRYGTHFTRENLYFTVGAACALNICFRALCNPGSRLPHIFRNTVFIWKRSVSNLSPCLRGQKISRLTRTHLKRQLRRKRRALS